MEIRAYQPEDLDQIKLLHEQCGFDYELPGLANPSMIVKRVLLDEHGIRVAAFLRSTAEAYLLVNGRWKSPAWRWEALKQIHEDVRREARRVDLEDVFCWPPREIAKTFGKRLEALGWATNAWPTYFRRVE